MFLLLLLACQSVSAPPTSPPPSAADSGPPVWKGAHSVVLGSGADCTIIALHGYGDRPENFARVYGGMKLNATVVFPRAPTPQGTGWAWFMSQRTTPPDDYAAAIGRAADRLASGIASGVPGATSPKAPIVTGFSQGGMLAWTLAAQHPDQVSAALPISGFLPAPLLPSGSGSTPIESFHGDADTVVAYAADLAGADRMKERGWPVVFHRYEGVPHTISPSMHRDYTTALQNACK